MKKMYKQLLTGGALFFAALGLVAQTTINTGLSATTSTGSAGNGITFVLDNTGTTAQKVTDVGYYITSAHSNTTFSLWVSSTSLSGVQPAAYPAAGWTLVSQVTTGTISFTGIQNIFTGLSHIIPPSTVQRFAMTKANAGPQYSSSGSTTYDNSGTSVLKLRVGAYQIGGQNVGYAATITPRYWAGSITYEEAAPPAANDAGVAEVVSPVLPACAGQYNLSVAVQNFGINQISPVTVNWSLGGVTQTPVTYTGTIDTVGGSGPDTAHVSLGTLNLTGFTTLRVWTTQPNNVADTNNVNDTLEIPLAPALEGVYTIQNSGGDFSTFTEAAEALANFGICGPVTMLAGDQTFNEQVLIDEIPGSSEVNTVTFKSNPTNANLAVLTYGPTGTADNYTVRFNGVKYVTFDSLEIRTTGTTYSTVVDFLGNNKFITVSRNNIAGAMSASTVTNNAVIYNPSGQTADSCYILDNEITGGSYGVYWYGNSATPREMGHKIIGNRITDFYFYGLYSYYNDDCDIVNNYIKNAVSAFTYSYGMYVYYNDRGSIIGNQVILANSGYNYGMYIYFNSGVSPTEPKIIANNFVSLTGGTGTSYGMQVYYGSFKRTVHNSVNIVSGSAAYGIYHYMTSTTYVDNQLLNNNVAVLGSGMTAIYRYNNTYDFSDNNNMYAPNGSVAYAGTAYATLEAYQTAGNEPNSINVDPEYVSATDLHTCNAELQDAATPVGLATDIDGQTRGALPDIGADEFMPGGAFDLGPDTTFCGSEFLLEVTSPFESIVWSVPGLPSNTSSSLLLTAGDEAADFNVNVVVSTGPCGLAYGSRHIRLVPDANTVPAGDKHLCAGEVGTLTANGGPLATYQWIASNQTTKTISVEKPGIHKLIKSEEGCVSEKLIAVTQSETPEVEEYYGVCPDAFPLALDATITHGTSYTWTGGNSPSTAVNTFDEDGEFTLTVEDSLGCTSTVPFAIEGIGVPTAGFSEKHDGFVYTFTAIDPNAGNAAIYQWVFSDEPSVVYSGQTITHAFPYSWGGASYTVSLTVANDCGDGNTSKQFEVNPLGVTQLGATDGDITVYPNPASGQLNVVIGTEAVSLTVELSDLTGRVVRTQTASHTNTVTVDLSGFSAGTYMLKANDGRVVYAKPVVVK